MLVRPFGGRALGALANAQLQIASALRPGVVQLSTGAWYDPADPTADESICVNGNPNVLTRDAGTSNLAQGCTGQLTVIDIERFDGPLPPVKAFDPPSQAD
jgi:biotin/methionine sulfoxide reductase